MQNLSCENDFFSYYHVNKAYFHKKGFALDLVLRVRFFGTRKLLACFAFVLFVGQALR